MMRLPRPKGLAMTDFFVFPTKVGIYNNLKMDFRFHFGCISTAINVTLRNTIRIEVELKRFLPAQE